jgi:O-antigen/teichoic acid export membrane protein
VHWGWRVSTRPPKSHPIARLSRLPQVRRLLGPADQALSSMSNFLPAALVARESTPGDFALVSIVLLTTNFGLGIVRSLTGEIQIAENRGSERAEDQVDREVGSASAAVLVSAVLGLVFVGISLLLHTNHDLSTATLVAGLVLPLISYQDHLRYVAFASDRPSIACVVDFAWIALFVGAFIAFPSWREWQQIAILWGVSGLLSSIPGVIARWIPVRLAAGVQWLRRTHHRGRYFAVEFLSVRGASTLALLALGRFGTQNALAVVRALQLLVSPVLVIFSGFALSLPLALNARMSGPTGMRALHRTMFRLGILATVFCVPFLVAPEAVGRSILGETWQIAYPSRIFLLPYVIFISAGVACRIMIRAVGAERRAVRLQLYVAPTVVFGPLLAAVTFGSRGAVGAVVITSGFTVAAWYVVARGKNWQGLT